MPNNHKKPRGDTSLGGRPTRYHSFNSPTSPTATNSICFNSPLEVPKLLRASAESSGSNPPNPYISIHVFAPALPYLNSRHAMALQKQHQEIGSISRFPQPGQHPPIVLLCLQSPRSHPTNPASTTYQPSDPSHSAKIHPIFRGTSPSIISLLRIIPPQHRVPRPLHQPQKWLFNDTPNKIQSLGKSDPVGPQNPNPMMRIDLIPEIIRTSRLSIRTTNPIELQEFCT
ncbi:hypothetical protein HOY80DRAFT_108284 [Tuber brumale]|nr:hypothetical protein HOY80DRAFT_108284 [Tuber brumale]